MNVSVTLPCSIAAGMKEWHGVEITQTTCQSETFNLKSIMQMR